MPERPKLVLIDGHALVYRAFFALPPTLATSKGELTNAVMGFASMLLKVLEEEEPDYIAVAFDRGRTFRHEDYPEYKANRAHMPSELAIQFQRIDELLDAFNIRTFGVEGFEADDVLAALAKQATEQDVDTLIVTGDTDTFQLIDPHVRVLTSRRQFSDTIIYDEQGIRERYGLEPKQLIDYKALTGDKSDNVPGVSGVGDKTATKLLQRYDSVEAIYAHLDEVESTRFRRALEEGRDMASLSKHLVTIRDDVPVRLNLDACQTRTYDRERVLDLFRDLEFRTLLSRLPEPARKPQTPGAVQQLSMFPEDEAPKDLAYQIVDTADGLDRLARRLAYAPLVVVDVESTSTNPMQAELVGLAITDAEQQGYYIPLAHQGADNLPLARVRETLGPILADPKVPKAAHNANYDLTVLAEAGLPVAGLTWDTMLAAWLLNPGSRGLGLKAQAFDRLGIQMTEITELIGTGKDQITMDQVPVERAAPYACADVDVTLRLVGRLEPELQAKKLQDLFAQIEIPLVPVIVEMQRAGVRLDVDALSDMSRQLGERIAELEAAIEEQVGHPINVGSTQQLSVALFDEMGLSQPWMRRGKSGHYSTAAGVLEKLRDRHPVVDLILEHRQLTKLKGTYIDTLPELVLDRTGRIHTSYNQAGTVTGRVSSSDPNLQNIPIRTEVGREIRRAFVADPGHVLLAADYSQVELRVLAHISGDPAMLAAFERGEDIHASTAAAIYGVLLDQVTSAQRRVAKMTNFAISYGVTDYGLAERTELNQEEAGRFIESYFRTYPQIREYIERTRQRARKQGYVDTLLGRRRYFPELQTGSRVHANVRSQALRMAINAPIQGSAADIIKIAMDRLWRRLREGGFRARMILQVHDELVLEVPDAEVEAVAPLVQETMERAFTLDAPLRVDMKVGRNWLEMESWHVAAS
jgi:DNA polymerase-1